MQTTTTAVSIGRAPSAYNVLRDESVFMDYTFMWSYDEGFEGKQYSYLKGEAVIADVRAHHGFVRRVSDLLTPPDAQHKLSMAVEPSFGLTLAHADVSGHELCPWRTKSCTQCCVVANGNGRYDSVQRAWQWRTTLLLDHPLVFASRLGWELGRAVRKYQRKGYKRILFRPNVNSDLPWHKLLPSMANLHEPDGYSMGWLVLPYGYTKDPSLLRGVSVNRARFNEAYSWNEDSKIDLVQNHLDRGGRLAVVTNRAKGQAVNARALRKFFGVDKSVIVRDADLTDEWMITPSRGRAVIGDLTAKGKARPMIGKSDFVVVVY
jgi:hypothetical protein